MVGQERRYIKSMAKGGPLPPCLQCTRPAPFNALSVPRVGSSDASMSGSGGGAPAGTWEEGQHFESAPAHALGTPHAPSHTPCRLRV